jgi:hypothetical protein
MVVKRLIPKGNKNAVNRRASKQSSGSSAVDSEFIRSHMLTGTTTTVVKSDLVSKPQNFNIVQSPPRNLFTQTFWVQLSADNNFGSSTSAITEFNLPFTLSTLPGAGVYLAAFDQYCIYSVIVTYAYLQENSAVTSSVQNVRIHSALDYDNVTNLGSITALQGFSTYSVSELAPNTSMIRFLKPCLATSLAAGTTNTVGAGIQRSWVDSAFPAISHYGFRSILGITQLSSVSVTLGVTAIVGFRNGI